MRNKVLGLTLVFVAAILLVPPINVDAGKDDNNGNNGCVKSAGKGNANACEKNPNSETAIVSPCNSDGFDGITQGELDAAIATAGGGGAVDIDDVEEVVFDAELDGNGNEVIDTADELAELNVQLFAAGIALTC